MDKLLTDIAKRIPEGIRNKILENNIIDHAVNVDVLNSPMEYLFDVYQEFIDATGEYGHWPCVRCRQHVLDDFYKLKPIMEELKRQGI